MSTLSVSKIGEIKMYRESHHLSYLLEILAFCFGNELYVRQLLSRNLHLHMLYTIIFINMKVTVKPYLLSAVYI